MAAIRLCPVSENQKARQMIAQSIIRRAQMVMERKSILEREQAEQIKVVVIERRSRGRD